MADPNQTPQRGDWLCPCNGCKKAAKQEKNKIVDYLKKVYYTCPNINLNDENHEFHFCYTWWRHTECLMLMDLIYYLTEDEKYSIPNRKEDRYFQ